jgi:hypothetical protein
VNQRRRRRWLVALVVFVSGGMLTHSTSAGTGDEPHYLAIAHSLAFDGDLDMANNYGAAEPLIGGGGLQPGLHVQPGTDGVLRPVHDVGLPLLFVPYVRVAVPLVTALAPRVPPALARRARLTPTIFYRNVIALGVIAIASALAIVTMALCEWAGATPRVAFWTTAVMVMSVPLSVFSFLFFTEIPSAAAAAAATFLLAARPPDARRWLAAGALAGLLLLVHSRNLGISAGLAVLVLVRLRQTQAWTAAAACLVGALMLFVLRAVLLHHLWGTLLTTKLAYGGTWGGPWFQARGVFLRVAGLLVDQEYGLLIYAPLFVLAVPGMLRLRRTHRDAWVAVSLVCGGYLLFVLLPLTNPYGWTGGWCPPARFLVPIVPFLVVLIAAAMPAIPRGLLVPLLAVQLVIDAYAWQHPKTLWNEGTGTAGICTRGTLTVCDWLPSLTRFRS